jgi:hypothetical protein
MGNIRRFKDANGTSWVAVRDWLIWMGLYLRPNGKPDTGALLKKMHPGFVRYEAVKDEKGKWIALAYAIEEEMCLAVGGDEPEEEPVEAQAAAVTEKTISEHFSLKNYKRSAILRTDSELRQLFFSQGGKKLKLKAGLAMFPTDFLETVDLEAYPAA